MSHNIITKLNKKYRVLIPTQSIVGFQNVEFTPEANELAYLEEVIIEDTPFDSIESGKTFGTTKSIKQIKK